MTDFGIPYVEISFPGNSYVIHQNARQEPQHFTAMTPGS